MKRNTEHFMSLWRSLLPVICKVQGYAIDGGTDIAFCSDLLMIAEDAKLGYTLHGFGDVLRGQCRFTVWGWKGPNGFC